MAKSQSWVGRVWQVVAPLTVVAAAIYAARDQVYGMFGLDPPVRISSAATRVGGENRLVLTNDLGEINGRARLWLQALATPLTAVHASIEEHTTLELNNRGVIGDTLVVDVWPSHQASTSAYFTWPPGDELVLAHTGAPFLLRDWRISTATGSITRYRANTRRGVDALFVIIGIFAIGAAIAKALQERRDNDKTDAAPPGDSGDSPSAGTLRRLITSVKGDNEKETDKVRAFLTSVLIEHAPPAEAVHALGHVSMAQALQIQSKAILRMRTRLCEFGIDVARWQTNLDNASRTDLA